jgi:glycosyltransferase involved in cell wall biosynthesis
MNNVEVSIVIRTYNEEKYLSDLLESLKGQSFQNFEIIVVDSGSLDRTREIAEKTADKILQLKSRDFTFGYALNLGIRESSGSFIAIASAHTLPIDEQWLSNLIAPLYDDKNAMVYGRQLGTQSSKFSEIQDFLRTYGLKRKVLHSPNFFANNANSAIRKDRWHQYPFDESLLGLEDIDWAKYWMEKGFYVVYEPEAALYHIHEESWRQVRRRYYREAVAARWIGVAPVRHAVANPALEATFLLLDWTKFLHQGNGIRRNDISFLKMVKETALFRANKSIGTIKGLLGGSIMENPKDREALLFDRACKAVVISGPNSSALQEVQIPEVKPGDVLIRTAYEAVCATDIEIYEGSLGYYKNGTAKYPIVPGHEFSGTIVEKGPNVNQAEIGDSVVVECIQSCGTCEACQKKNWIACSSRTELGVVGRNGGYSEYVVVPGRFVHRLPLDFDMRKACLCEPLAVVLKGLKRLSRTWGKKKISRSVSGST